MRVFFLLLFFSQITWADPKIAIFQRNTAASLETKKIRLCWNEEGKFDGSLCGKAGEYQCEKEVVFNFTQYEFYKNDKTRRNSTIKSKNDKNFVLNVKKKTLGYSSFAGRDVPWYEAFETIDSVKIKGKSSVDITKLFTVKGGRLHYKNHDTFTSYFKPIANSFTLNIKGTCGQYGTTYPLNIYPVFEKADKSSKQIGRIITFLIPNSGWPAKTYIKGITSKEVTDYPMNITSSWGLLKQVDEVKDNFINVGKGPWGNSGWSEVPVVGLFSGRAVYFEWVDNTVVEYFKESEGVYYKRAVPKISSEKDSLALGEIFKVQKDEIFDEKGLIKLKVAEISRDNRNTSRVPTLVDLTGGQFLTNGKNQTRTVPIYSKNSVGFSLSGSLELKFNKNNLSAVFIDSGNKRTRFESDYFMGRCGNDMRFTALNSVKDKDGLFSQIGEGPWGKEGWVREPRYSIYDLSLPITFSYLDREVDHIEFNSSYNKLKLNFSPRHDGRVYSTIMANTKKREKGEPASINVSVDQIEMDGKMLLDYSCKEATAVKREDYDYRYVNLLENAPLARDLFRNCKADVDVSLHPYCQVTEEKCEGYFYNEEAFKKTDLTIALNKNVTRLSLQMNKDLFSNFEWGNRIKTKVGTFLYPSKINVYAITSSLNENSSKKVVDNEITKKKIEVAFYSAPIAKDHEYLNLTYPEKFEEVLFSPSDFKEDTLIKVYIGDSFILPFLSESQKVILKLSEGEFPFRFEYEIGKKKYILDKKIKVTKKSTVLKFSAFDFVEKSESFIEAKTNLADSFIPFNTKHRGSFHHDKVTLIKSDSTENLSSLMRSQGSGLTFIDNDHVKDIQEKLASEAYAYLKVGGKCRTVNMGTIVNRYNVYASDSEKSKKLGHLELSTVWPNENGLFFKDNNKNSSMVPVLLSDTCSDIGPMKEFLVIGARAQKGEWVNLGYGPWGISGFIKGFSSPILHSKLEYRLYGKSLIMTDFEEKMIDTIVIGDEGQLLIPFHQFFTSEGKLKNTFSCPQYRPEKGT